MQWAPREEHPASRKLNGKQMILFVCKRICVLRLSRGRFVGVDAHIDPMGTYEFAADRRKIGAICRGDVGIAPYASFDMPVSK